MISARLVILTAVGLALAIAGCDDSVGPHPWSAFAGKQLYARWSGGDFGTPHGVVIYDDGTAHAIIPGGRFEPDTLLPMSRPLNPRERVAIVGLIKPFPTFERSYLAGYCGEFITVGLVSEGSWREVLLCSNSQGVPGELHALVHELLRIELSLPEEE